MAWSRQSRHARGYGTRWDVLRAQVLRNEPLCRVCRAAGRVRAAVQVDHVIPKAKGGTDRLDNLQPICRRCHDAKTAAELGRRVRAQVGLDGWSRSDDQR